MATTGIVNGTILLLFVDGVAISSTTSHTLNFEMATRDATTKSSGGFEEVLEGLRSWTLDFDAMTAFDDTFGYKELRALIAGRSEVTLLFSSIESGDPQWSGRAFLTTLSLDGAVEDSTTMSGSFKGTGELTETVIT